MSPRKSNVDLDELEYEKFRDDQFLISVESFHKYEFKNIKNRKNESEIPTKYLNTILAFQVRSNPGQVFQSFISSIL